MIKIPLMIIVGKRQLKEGFVKLAVDIPRGQLIDEVQKAVLNQRYSKGCCTCFAEHLHVCFRLLNGKTKKNQI